MASLKDIWTQYFPLKPTFTEKDVPKQPGKVFIVTGSNQGIGFELVKMLYPLGATVYLACRSEERATKAIEEITSTLPKPPTPSTLKYLHLDLNDLSTIKASAAAFASQETKLDILWNNAGIGANPKGSTTKQGIEAHVGINCVAPLLFTQELLPQLKAAAASASAHGSSRVIWTSSLMSDTHSPKDGGIDYTLLDHGATTDPYTDYAASKVGNYLLSAEMASRHGSGKEDSIISVAQNPGNLKTNIYSHQPWLLMLLLKFFLYDQKFGGYTLLYAGFSPEFSVRENNGAYVWPFGRRSEHSRADIRRAVRDGGAKRFWEWCESKYRPFV